MILVEDKGYVFNIKNKFPNILYLCEFLVKVLSTKVAGKLKHITEIFLSIHHQHGFPGRVVLVTR